MEILQTQHIQMTEQEYQESKREIKERFCRIANDALYIGWKLTCIEESSAYRYDGYESMKEFAEAEYKMSADKISRYPRVYKKYGIPGEIPQLKQEYEKYNFSQLIEMLQIPEEDEAMIRPELKRDGIRELVKFNKENENNPNNLLGWQQDPEKDLKCAILEFFRNRKESLNTLYASEAYAENDIPEMIRIIRNNQKKQFRDSKTSIFMILYEDQIFVKACNKDPQDITWERFFEIAREIFDHAAAGDQTWEHFFEPEKFVPAQEEQIPGQDSIMNHPEYTPEPQGQLHGKKFPNCVYISGTECIAEDCEECSKKKEFLEDRTKRKMYMGALAEYLLENYYEYFMEDHMNRVTQVHESERNLKEKLKVKKGSPVQVQYSLNGKFVYAHLYTDRISVEEHDSDNVRHIVAEYEWFYLCAEIQGNWNRFAIKRTRQMLADEQKRQQETKEGPEFTEEIAPAQKEENQTCIHRSGFPCTLSEAQKMAAGDGEDCNSKCCWECPNHGNCSYECNSSAHRPEEIIVEEPKDTAKMQQDTEKRCENNSEVSGTWPEILSDIPIPSWPEVCDILRNAENNLKEYLACEGIPHRTILKEQLVTGGLRLIKNLVGDIPEERTGEPEQPELPVFKNNDQRKEWLRDYKSWGLWYEDKNIGVRYYKYDFDNGARLIAEVHEVPGSRYYPAHDFSYLHLIGGPEPPKTKHGPEKWRTYEKYNRYANNETELVEFLKEVQK